jgi:hypothetical protein
VVGSEEPLFVQFAIPLSKSGGPLQRQIYSGLRRAILSGTFDPDTRLPFPHATWPSSWAFRVRLSWKLMTSCWPKVLSSAAAVREHTSPRFCPPTDWLCPGRLQRCSYRDSGPPLQMRRQLSMDRSRRLGIAMISSLAGARVTSKLFLSSTGSAS